VRVCDGHRLRHRLRPGCSSLSAFSAGVSATKQQTTPGNAKDRRGLAGEGHGFMAGMCLMDGEVRDWPNVGLVADDDDGDDDDDDDDDDAQFKLSSFVQTT